MDLQTSHDQPTQQKKLFNNLNIKELVQQSVLREQKRIKGQFLKQSNKNEKYLESQFLMQDQRYSFDSVSKTIYILDHQLISSDQNVVEKSLFQLSNFFKFLLENPCHKIKNGEIINVQHGQQEMNRKINIQVLNPLIARMLDMFLNSKIFVFKNYIAEILIHYSFVIKQVFIKQELLQVLNKGIKGFDQYTRIMSVKIVPSYIEMFQKDLFGFQYILHKIQSFEEDNQFIVSLLVQKMSFVECLSQILQKSDVLSSFFIKNINQQTAIVDFRPSQRCLMINKMSIIRFFKFCLCLKLNSSVSLVLFRSLLKIYKNRSNHISKIDKKTIKILKQVLSKLFKKMFDCNFKVLQTLYSQEIENQIQLDLGAIYKKFKSFDFHQQKYILKNSPQKLKLLLSDEYLKTQQKPRNIQQILFLKFYQKINKFDNDIDQNKSIVRQNILIKLRRLEEFIELCTSLNQQKIILLVQVWISLYDLMLDLINQCSKQEIQKKLESTKSLIQNTASQYQNLDDQILVSGQMFLYLEKSNKYSNYQFFKQSLWVNNQKLSVKNKHYLKWTHLNQNTLEKLNL